MSASDQRVRYAGVICDLDGVVYRGPAPVPHAVDVLTSLRHPVVYATNNASRPSAAVAAQLHQMGLPVDAAHIATSAEAAAWLLATESAPGARVLVVGGTGVTEALRAQGLTPVRPGAQEADDVIAVVQGYGPDVTASDLAEVGYAARRGVRWIATNIDRTLPTDRGVAPGNGALVAAVVEAAARRPAVVVGKPGVWLYEMCAHRIGVEPSAMLAVGDRLDTDIAGAAAMGMHSLLVLSGVDGVAELLAAPPSMRPTWVAPDLQWLPVLLGDTTASEALQLLRHLREVVAEVHHAIDRGVDTGARSLLQDRVLQMLDRLAHR
ncbi:MAG: HAD-IIA family hydrolase [Phycicoccus sp.]